MIQGNTRKWYMNKMGIYIRRQKAWKETKKKFLLKGTITETKKDHRGI
jgi:hypothetical protein